VKLFGFDVCVHFLISGNNILAYSWHYTEEGSLKHFEKIKKYHSLHGEILKSEKLESWLDRKLREVLLEGKRFKIPPFEYKNSKVYYELTKVPKGKTLTYSELARKSKTKYHEMLVTLLRNPFQVLIPCHRLLTNKGGLMGFYPLGKDVKRRLLEIEGIELPNTTR